MGDGARLGDRFGILRTHGTLVAAAVIAAHGASARSEGFRATDVRFFFYLFSNWLEHDLLHATEPLELTQVRRLMARLAARGWVRVLPSGARHERRSGLRHALTPEGLAGLVDALTSELDRRTFEEALFVVCFARSYRDAIALRASPARRRHVAARLSPERLLRAAEQRVERVIADLDERVRSSAVVHDEATHLRRAGVTDTEIAAMLDRRDTYQLQHVRSFGEVMGALPSDILHFELGEGLAARSRFLFEPMAAHARAQGAILHRLRLTAKGRSA
jgi:hypothetical protein